MGDFDKKKENRATIGDQVLLCFLFFNIQLANKELIFILRILLYTFFYLLSMVLCHIWHKMA